MVWDVSCTEAPILNTVFIISVLVSIWIEYIIKITEKYPDVEIMNVYSLILWLYL